jgi:hypothetical protein
MFIFSLYLCIFIDVLLMSLSIGGGGGGGGGAYLRSILKTNMQYYF